MHSARLVWVVNWAHEPACERIDPVPASAWVLDHQPTGKKAAQAQPAWPPR